MNPPDFPEEGLPPTVELAANVIYCAVNFLEAVGGCPNCLDLLEGLADEVVGYGADGAVTA